MAHRIYKYIFNPLLFFCRRLLLRKTNKYIEMNKYPFFFNLFGFLQRRYCIEMCNTQWRHTKKVD